MTSTNNAIAAFDPSLARPDRLGPVTRDGGVNFALFSENADRVELCLFDEAGDFETVRVDLPDMEGGIWFGFIPDLKEGQRYGYRVHGAYAPEEGHRFNANKLLLDPYARALMGEIKWDNALHGYQIGKDDLSFDERDSAPFMPKGIVVSDGDMWDRKDALSTPWEKSVLYEGHVRGLTMKHPLVSDEDRGTFAGLASDPMLEHLNKLGVTAIELLPIQAFANDRHLVEKGLSNYWGYNTLSFFAPQQRYMKSWDLLELKTAIDRFHAAGIEVILDVVYNHTCEGNENGPTLSFRGIDNAAYYLLSPDDRRHSFDTTGTGNTLNVAHPFVLRMVLDSLRYWVEVMKVDGFRFDLASTLGREATGFEREGAFFAAICQDPILSTVKLIAEPWDIGEGGYQVGGFPWPFREWNDKARDDIRSFWRGDDGQISPLSERLSGSPVQFNHSHRPATSSINFVAAHDGFTLMDTVSYDDKHNEANGENSQDGHDNNLSHNLGAEGPADSPKILEARRKRISAMLATLAFSQGVPMILAGDEFGQTQNGNNNAYCQDNDLTWLDWEAADETLMEQVAAALALRNDLAGYIQPRFARAGDVEGYNRTRWYHPAGREMHDEDWSDGGLRCFGKRTETDSGVDILIIFNAGDDVDFTVPDGDWSVRFQTSIAQLVAAENAAAKISVSAQSVTVILRTT